MVNLDDIVIDPEFRDFLPAVADLSRLRAKVELEGWTDEPITVWQHHNILLDGHNRVAIWKEREDDGPPVREMQFETREAAFHWVVNNQCARRNLTAEEQRFLLGRKYTAEKKVEGAQKGNAHARKQLGENLPVDSVGDRSNPTAKRIGEQAGVSDFTVKQAEKYADAVDDLDRRGVVAKADVLSGKVKVTASKIIAASKAPTPEEAKAVIAVVAENKAPKAKEADSAPETNGVVKRQGIGVLCANEAINCLIRIPKDDPLRKRGFQIVTDWIKANK